MNGIWNGGKWKNDLILDKNTGKYIESDVSPNKCKWSWSYER